MGSKVLPQYLLSLSSAAPPRSTKQGHAAFSSCRLAITRPPLFSSGPTVLSPVVRRRRHSTVVSASSAPEEAETTGDAEAEAAAEGEGEEAIENEAPAEDKPPRKPIIKLGDIMGILNKRAIEASEKERPVPDIRTGDVVVIKLEVPENRRRLSIYKGIVISRQNAGIHTTIRIRRIIAGIGVEIVFPIYSPNIKEIKVVSHRKVRRARLYYLRNKLPRLSTFK